MCVENGWSYFKTWWKSFTCKEKILTILETILLVSLIVLIVVVIFHFLYCESIQNNRHTTVILDTTTESVSVLTKRATSTDDNVTTIDQIEQSNYPIVSSTDAIVTSTDNIVTNKNDSKPSTNEIDFSVATQKTDAGNYIISTLPPQHTTTSKIQEKTEKLKITCTTGYTIQSTQPMKNKTTTAKKRVMSDLYAYNDMEYNNDDLDIYPNPDFYGELDNINEVFYKNYLAAFVKVSDMKLGCPLTLLSKFWSLTAASCIENIKNIQSIDNYGIVEYYNLGEAGWNTHNVAEIKIHPRFGGFNRSFDVTVLKTDDEMEFEEKNRFLLPTMYDFLMMNIGDKLNIIGFGVFRNNTKKNPNHSEIIQTNVFVLPRSQCPYSIEEYEEISLRNLKVGPSMNKKDKPCCQETNICAGVLFRRRFPCYFCSGTPLFKGKFLMGIMGDNEECGVTCEPMHYVAVASIAEWLKFIMKT